MKAKKKVIGLTEKVKVMGPKGKSKALTARIDTGATISSIDNKLAASLKLGPVIRTKLVKSAQGSGSRAVIRAKVAIAGKELRDEFTIADRKHMKYQILIGQNILRKGFLIDPYNSLAKDKDALSGLTGHDYDYLAASMMRMFCSKNNVSIWLNTHAVTTALRSLNKKGQNYEGFPSPPMAADSEGGGKWVNRASDFMVIHRYSQHPTDWMYSHLHVRKVKEMETGGRPTPMQEPIVLRSKPGNVGFTIGGVDLIAEMRENYEQLSL